MKGMLTKAFSLALLISVVPSFAMDHKVAAEELSNDAVMIVRQAADDMKEATSTAATIKGAAVGLAVNSAITNTAPTLWERVKGYANSASSYATTDNLKTAGKYALGLAAVYAGYRTVKAVYNYATTPATKKAEAASQSIAIEAKAKPVVAPVAKKAVVSKPAKAVVITAQDGQEAVALVDKIVADKNVAGLRAKYQPEVDKNVVLANFTFNSKGLSLPLELAPQEQTLADTLVKCMTELAKGSKTQQASAQVTLGQIKSQVHTLAAAITAEQANLMAKPSKASFGRMAYNAIANRYVLGAASIAGLGYAGYKYGVSFYNRVK